MRAARMYISASPEDGAVCGHRFQDCPEAPEASGATSWPTARPLQSRRGGNWAPPVYLSGVLGARGSISTSGARSRPPEELLVDPLA